MKWMKRTALALAAGAALSFSAGPSQAASVGQAATATSAAIAQTDSNLIEVRRGHRHGHRHWRHHHGHGFRGWWIPFVAAPLLYGGYAYGSGYGNSCYSECRAYNGPRYCRYYWRRYC